ncbi:MAG: pyridoxal 5'-phosphate synthase glutaminase subunit PdxT [Spirochaetaceae bacterium]
MDAPIGVLAFQGDFGKHMDLVASMGREAVPVRSPDHLDGIGALIIPGGESTTIGMLCERFGLLERIRERAGAGLPILGTCAGAILLARDIVGSDQPRLGLLDIEIRRNAYGRQIESFEANLTPARELAGSDEEAPLRGVFIRAPLITRVDNNVEVIARFEESPVVVRQGNIVAATFHPELTGEVRIHRLLLTRVPNPTP